MDKAHSIYLGRPPRLRAVDTTMPISLLDDYEDLEEFNALSYAADKTIQGRPNYSTCVFQRLCKLNILAENVLCTLYTQRSRLAESSRLHRETQSLHHRLERWRRRLPQHLAVQLDDHNYASLTPHLLSMQ